MWSVAMAVSQRLSWKDIRDLRSHQICVYAIILLA